MNREASGTALDLVPARQRPAAAAALHAVGADDAPGVVVTGGASGATIVRVDAGTRPLLLRIETNRDPARDPHRTHPIMTAAAAAGVAPAVHHADADAGVVVMDFVAQVPLAEHPGGPAAIATELGALIATLQACPVPAGEPGGFGDMLAGLLDLVAGAGLFAAGVLDDVAAASTELRGAYPWSADAAVAGHNDVNPFNVLSDGQRLWLIDWELAFANDRFNDIAIVANNVAPTPDLERLLVTAWLGQPPTDTEQARLTMMRALSRLFYGCVLLSTAIGRVPCEDTLAAPTEAELTAALLRGEHSPTDPATLHTLGKMQLLAFLASADDPALRTAVATVTR